MDSTPYGPSYWSTLHGRADRVLCEKILDKLKSKLYEKQRQILREYISEAVRVREDMIKREKHGQYIKAVVREEVSPFIFDSLFNESGDLITGLEIVQQKFTTYYTKAYEMPERHKGGIHLPDWQWKTGGTKQDFLKRVHHHNIPSHNWHHLGLNNHSAEGLFGSYGAPGNFLLPTYLL